MSPKCHISFFHLTDTNILLTLYKSNQILVLPIKGSITFRSAPLKYFGERKKYQAANKKLLPDNAW